MFAAKHRRQDVLEFQSILGEQKQARYFWYISLCISTTLFLTLIAFFCLPLTLCFFVSVLFSTPSAIYRECVPPLCKETFKGVMCHTIVECHSQVKSYGFPGSSKTCGFSNFKGAWDFNRLLCIKIVTLITSQLKRGSWAVMHLSPETSGEK